MKVEKVAYDPVASPHFPVWWKSAFNLHPSPISKPRTLPTSTGSIWFCFLMLSHCPHMTWCLHWNIFVSHKWPQCPLAVFFSLLLSSSSSPPVNLLYRKGAIKKYVLAVGAGLSNCPDSVQCWLGADELWVQCFMACCNSTLEYSHRGKSLCFSCEFIHHQKYYHQKRGLTFLQDHYKGLKENASLSYLSDQTTLGRSAKGDECSSQLNRWLKKHHL